MIKSDFNEPILITITNQKGGVGKTTVTINLAEQLAKQGYETLIIDTDTQGNVSDRLLNEDIEESLANVLDDPKRSISSTVYPTKYESLFVLPSGKNDLSDVITKVNRRCTGLRQLTEGLNRIKKDISGDIHFVLIDTPPSHRSLLLRSAYAVSDYTLLVIEPELSSLRGILQNHEVFEEEQRYNSKLKLLGTVLNMVDRIKHLSSPATFWQANPLFRLHTCCTKREEYKRVPAYLI